MKISLSLVLCASLAATALASPINKEQIYLVKESVGGHDCSSCLPIAKCPPLLKLARERKFDRLREQKRCGFEKREALLCCPTSESIEEEGAARKDINTRKLTEVNPVHVEIHVEENVPNEEDGTNKICMKELHYLKAAEGHQCGTPGRRFNRNLFGLTFGLKNGFRLRFDSETCLNYPFLSFFLVV